MGVDVDYSEALNWYEKVANKGDVNTYCFIGRANFLGEGVEAEKPQGTVPGVYFSIRETSQ